MAENFALQVLQNQRRSLQLEFTRLKAQRDAVADQLEAVQLQAEQLDHAISEIGMMPVISPDAIIGRTIRNEYRTFCTSPVATRAQDG